LAVSGTDAILGLVNMSNCGQPGVWLFRIDEVKKIDEDMCESKGKLIRTLPRCPYRLFSDVFILFLLVK